MNIQLPLKLSIVFLLLAPFSGTTYSQKYKPYWDNKFQLNEQQKKFLDTLQYKSFLYFINEINPENGLVKDRSTKDSPASIASVAFAIPIWALASEKGWIEREKAINLTLAALRFFWNSEQSLDSLATGYKGFYYHFLDMNTGKRFWNSELSSIDSGLLFCGFIFARQFYNRSTQDETEIRKLSHQLLNRVDWEWFTLKDSQKYPFTISLGWEPNTGFHQLGWWGYTEALFLYIIAAGMDMPNVEKGYQTWLSYYKWKEPYKGLAHVVFPALFVHQFSMIFLDMRNQVDSYMKEKRSDYFENSRRATYVQWQYAIENPNGWTGYDSLTWGLSACDGPGSKYNFDEKKFWDYSARGTSGSDSTFDDGTLAPYSLAASIPFAPEICIPSLINIKEKYGSKGLWGHYGFYDAFNPTLNWYDKDYLGIDQGPIVLMIENYFNEFVWKYFMKDPIVINGLKKLGFEKK